MPLSGMSIIRLPLLTPDVNTKGVLGISAFAYYIMLAFVLGFLNRLYFLSLQTFATERSLKHSNNSYLSAGLLYGCFLAIIDFGDSASSWLSSPLIASQHIEYGPDPPAQWDGLVVLTWVEIVTTSSVLVVFGGLLWVKLKEPVQEELGIGEVEEEFDLEEEEEARGQVVEI